MCHKPTLHSRRQYLATPTLLFQIGISTPRAHHWSSILELVLIVFGALRFHFAGIFELLRGENRPHPENRTERKEAGLLGQTKSRLGSNLAVLGLKVGRTGAHLDPTWA